jgi:hypothetical protein
MKQGGEARWERQRMKRLAIQIAAQLPEDEEEALAVLFWARDLITGYMHDDDEPAEKPALIMHLVKKN